MRGAEPGHGAQAEGHPRNGRDVGDHGLPPRDAGDVGATGGFDGLDGAAAARAFDQTDEREAHLVRHLLALQVLLLDGRVRRATPHGEVVTADHHRPAIEPGAAEDEVAGDESRQVVPLVVGGLAGNLADLVEGAGIGELLDPLADGVSPAVVLAFHALRPAELLGELFPASKFLEFSFPAHRGGSRFRLMVAGLIPGPSWPSAYRFGAAAGSPGATARLALRLPG